MKNALIESLETIKSIAYDIDAVPQVRMQIENLQSSLENQRFYLPIVGQFSSGKSHFINNLLDRDLLPTKTTETTSFLTTILFSEQEGLIVKMVDGQVVVLDIAMTKCLNQQNITSGELHGQLKGINIDEIQSLEIKLNNKLLKEGLVLVDTPGINTLHTAHEVMTYEFLPVAQAFLYVSSSQPSVSDLNFLQHIKSFGLDVIFIRTRIDEINQIEEPLEQVISEDCDILQQTIDTESHYFAISNIIENPIWNERFLSTKAFLEHYFAIDVKNALQRSVNQKVMALKDDFRAQLDQITQLIKFEYHGEPEQFENDIKQLTIELELQKKDSKLLKEALENEFEHAKRETVRELELLKEQALADYQSSLSMAAWIDSPERVRDYSDQCVKSLAESINKRVSERLTQSVEQIYRQRNEQWSKAESVSDRLLIDGFSLKLTTPTLDEVITKSDDALLAISRQLDNITIQEAELSGNVSELSKNVQFTGQELAELNGDVDLSKDAVNQLQYNPQYIVEPGDSSFSKTFSMLGQAVDVAIMFMPTPAAPAKAALNAKKVVDATKMTKKAIKVAQTAKKTSQIIHMTKEAIDKYKPIVHKGVNDVQKLKEKAAQEANKLANSENEAEKNIGQVALDSLQLLEAEFWMRKLGENFDEPSRKRIDQQHYQQFEELRTKAEHEMQGKVQKQLTKLRSMGLLNEKVAYESKKQELLVQRKSELELELNTAKDKSEREKKAHQRAEFSAFYSEQMAQTLTDYIELIKASSDSIVEEFMIKLSISVMMDSEDKIKELQGKISELNSGREMSEQEKEQKLAQISVIADKLESLSV